jgi:RNA polymerase sigma factor (sigma-70 family)
VRLRAGAELRAHESCADLVQSVCAEVLADLPSLEYRGPEAFRAWVFAVAERKLADRGRFWRADKRDRATLAAAPDWSVSDAELADFQVYTALATPSQGAIAREGIERLQRAFAQLSEAHREVIVLSRIAGLSHQRIAEKLGKSEQAARSLLFRALAELAEAIEAK